MAKSSNKCGIYDGMGDVDIFIQEFRITSIYQKWDATAQLTNLPIFLRNKAKRVYDAVDPKTTIEEALKGLRTGCKPSNETLLMTYYKRRLQPDELISEFAFDLQDMLHNAFPDLQPAVQTAWLRTNLCMSLPEDLQTLVNFTADNLTWDQLLTKLDQMDAHRSGRTKNSSSRSSGYFAGNETPANRTFEPSPFDQARARRKLFRRHSPSWTSQRQSPACSLWL